MFDWHSCAGLLQQHCTSFSDDSMTPWLVFLAVASPPGKTAGRRTCDIQESKSILEIDILVLVVDPHPSQGEKLTFIFRPWHDSQQLTIRVSSRFNILEICKNNVWFQSWCRVHESQSISRWEESSDSNLPPIPCLLTTKCGNCKWKGSAGEQSPKICNLSDLSDSSMQHQSLQSWDPSHQAILIQKKVGRILNFRNHQSTKAECEKGWKKWKRYQQLWKQ